MKEIAREYRGFFKNFSFQTKRFILAMFILSLTQNAYSTIFNLYLSYGGIKNVVIGQIIFMSGIGASIIALPSGFIGDRVGRKKLLVASALVLPVLLLIESITINVTTLTIVSVLNGIAGVILHISTDPFLAENSKQEERVHLFSLFFILSNLGAVFGSFFAGRLVLLFKVSQFLSLRYTLIVFAVLSFLPFLIVLPMEDKKTTVVKPQFLTREDFSLILKFGAQNAFIGFGAGMSLPFLNLYFSQVFGMHPSSISTIFSVSSIFFLFFGLFGPRISRRIGVVKGALLYEILSVPFLIILAQSIPLYLAVFSFWMRGGLMNAGSPLLSTIQMSLVSQERRGTLTSFLNLFDNIFRAFGTLLGGAVIQKVGFQINFLFTAIFYIIAIAIFYFFFRDRNILESAPIEESVEINI
ncbi:MAG: MFS transporter [Caldisericaceae bacterium]